MDLCFPIPVPFLQEQIHPWAEQASPEAANEANEINYFRWYF